ncbi:hypothetical protein AN189_11955 [Loktanella sp. 3ANDIMAR09]|uniref:DUF3572 domain-containing protein n=1 Tax=Loktanella sp. 3ANDIMAR09 TaxID=1225657 RepID=UPI0006F34706|nr:DUF3572 domain-containing protein [Loktanella sp. 3ANDIMAR09]KQI68117.1 hypothetical protein AN189_11955 [Loktanella sp. 3ANDIMAR09]
MTPEYAEIIALQALAHVVADQDLSAAFMGPNGLSAGDMRAGATDPAFLAALLEFLCQRDDWVMAFCDAHGHAYEVPMQARYSLPGNEEVSWT